MHRSDRLASFASDPFEANTRLQAVNSDRLRARGEGIHSVGLVLLLLEGLAVLGGQRVHWVDKLVVADFWENAGGFWGFAAAVGQGARSVGLVQGLIGDVGVGSAVELADSRAKGGTVGRPIVALLLSMVDLTQALDFVDLLLKLLKLIFTGHGCN